MEHIKEEIARWACVHFNVEVSPASRSAAAALISRLTELGYEVKAPEVARAGHACKREMYRKEGARAGYGEPR